ncbi:MAG: protein kinase [Desulfococcaceae bacterium]
MKTKERVLLICLKPEESLHIGRLLSSFEIESESVMICDDNPDAIPLDQDISLAVFRIDRDSIRPDQAIRRLRRYFSHTIPILLLVDPEMLSGIRDYLKAGADDYWVLPLDETAFSVRFYVLLEYGQTMLHSSPSKSKQAETAPEPEPSFLQRMIARFQDSLRYFSPRIAAKEADAPIASRWEKVRLLGAGGFGEVWLVRRTGKEIQAVAKIPHSPQMNIRALRSAAILRRMSVHPNVIHLIEVVKEEGKVILILEYIEGETLQAMLDRGMPRMQKEKIFLQLLSVMAHAHEHRIMHRDIKPENMIILPSGHLKLIDFGIAKDMSRQSISRTVVGSRPFMSPEQIMGRSSLASDVWAMGVLLYILLTDSLPFYAANDKDMMDAILEMPPMPPRELNADISEALESVMLRSLEKDPVKRYADAVELRSDIIRRVPEFGKGQEVKSVPYPDV